MSQFPTLISLAKSVRDKKCVRLLVTKENQKKKLLYFLTTTKLILSQRKQFLYNFPNSNSEEEKQCVHTVQYDNLYVLLQNCWQHLSHFI